MARLTDEELDGAIKTWTGNGSFVERVLIELRERRAADSAVELVAQLAREVLVERPPIPGMPNTVHAELTAAVIALDSLLGGRR